MLKLFSVDDHIVEHPRVWTDRVSKKFLDVAPHIVKDGGYEWWECENGTRIGTTGLNAVAGKPPSHWNLDPMQFNDMIPGCYDPKERARDLLANGVLASVGFPTLPRFGGALFTTFKDKELADECVRAYNDFVLQEWCPAGPPGLYVPLTIVQLWDPELAAKEVARCVEMGARSICLPEATYPLELPSYYSETWDPVFAVIQEADVPISMHIGSSGFIPPASPEAAFAVPIALGTIGIQLAAIDLIMSTVFTRFPKLKVVCAEGGIGWLPPALERADRQFKRHSLWSGQQGRLPSEVFRANIYLAMVEEPWAVEHLRHDIGVDHIMWELDYPHSDSTWPFAQDAASKVVTNVPSSEAELMLYGNAERLFNWNMADSDLAVHAEPIPRFEWDTPPDVDAPARTEIDHEGVLRCRKLVVEHGLEAAFCNESVSGELCAAGHVVESTAHVVG
jgi:predicted TIM-barrel fold metal-dependent hydrolase